MKFYNFPISPHDSAEHADMYFDGWCVGTWEHSNPPIAPHMYRVVSKNEDAAEDSRQKLEKATVNFDTWEEFLESV